MLSIIKKLESQSCPCCGSSESEEVIKLDRYFLPIEISVCTNCNMVYTKKNFPAEKLNDFYENYYRWIYNDAPKVTETFIRKSKDEVFASVRLKSMLKFHNDNRINTNNLLEVGAGTGYFSKVVSDSGFAKVTSYEPGKVFGKYAQSINSKANVKNEFFISDNITEQYDFAAAFHVLEHIADPISFLKNIRSVLADDGYLMLEVPGYDLDFEWDKYGVMSWHIGHRNYFTSESISNVLGRSGFEVVLIEKSLTEGISLNNLRVYAKVTENIKSEDVVHDKLFSKNFKLKSKKNKFSILSGYPRALVSSFKEIIKLAKI